MSVIAFSGAEMDKFMGQLRGCKEGYGEMVFNRVCRWHPWAARQRQEYETHCKLDNEEATENGFYAWMINHLGYYLLVANRVAYGLTYKGETVEFHTDLGDEVKATPTPPKKCYSDLRHLDYNLCSNGGTVFMAEGWGDFWRACKEAVAAAALQD